MPVSILGLFLRRLQPLYFYFFRLFAVGSFPTEDLVANFQAFLGHLSGMRPSAVKGTFVRRISVSTTMGPGAFIEYGG